LGPRAIQNLPCSHLGGEISPGEFSSLPDWFPTDPASLTFGMSAGVMMPLRARGYQARWTRTPGIGHRPEHLRGFLLAAQVPDQYVASAIIGSGQPWA